MKMSQEIENSRFSVVTPKGVKVTEEYGKVYSTTYIARQYGIPRDKFFGMLILADVAYYRFRRHLPKRYLIDSGYFILDKRELEHTLDGSKFKVTRGWWTNKGSHFLANLLRRRFCLQPKHKWYEE